MFGFASKSVAPLDRQGLIDAYLGIRPKIERVIARRVGSLELAADLAQELFFKIDTIKIVIHTTADAERYFMRAAVNAAFDVNKIEARRRAILHENSPVLAHDGASPADSGILARDDLRRVEAALEELPEKCRQVFILSRFQGLTHAEIAAKLGVSQSLVEKYVVRAMLHCRAKLID